MLTPPRPTATSPATPHRLVGSASTSLSGLVGLSRCLGSVRWRGAGPVRCPCPAGRCLASGGALAHDDLQEQLAFGCERISQRTGF